MTNEILLDSNAHTLMVVREGRKWALDQAREDLTEKLHAGGTVDRLTLRDMIDSDMNGSRAGFAAIELTNLVLADSAERAALADTYVASVIERYLTEELVHERAEEIMADREEE